MSRTQNKGFHVCPRITMTALVALATLCLASCAPYKVVVLAPLDRSDKTITIAAGAAGLKGPIKETLRREGWKIRTDAGPTKTTGAVGADVDLQTSSTFRTRYRMAIDSDRIDTCIPSGALYVFELAIIDNDSGDEIMTMDGRECEGRIVEDFLAWLRGNNVRQTSR